MFPAGPSMVMPSGFAPNSALASISNTTSSGESSFMPISSIMTPFSLASSSSLSVELSTMSESMSSASSICSSITFM